MGMSASQARLIALTARMSDVEYEGQQINQARLTLANQVAEITNQLYSMNPPTAPNEMDFTYMTYTGKDHGDQVALRGRAVSNGDGTYSQQMKIATKGTTLVDASEAVVSSTPGGGNPGDYIDKEHPYTKNDFVKLDPKDYEEYITEDNPSTIKWSGFGNGTDDKELCTGSYTISYKVTEQDKDGNDVQVDKTQTFQITERTERSAIEAEAAANTPSGASNVNVTYSLTSVFVGTKPSTSFQAGKEYHSTKGEADISGDEAIEHNTTAKALSNKKFAIADGNSYKEVSAEEAQEYSGQCFEITDVAKFQKAKEDEKSSGGKYVDGHKVIDWNDESLTDATRQKIITAIRNAFQAGAVDPSEYNNDADIMANYEVVDFGNGNYGVVYKSDMDKERSNGGNGLTKLYRVGEGAYDKLETRQISNVQFDSNGNITGYSSDGQNVELTPTRQLDKDGLAKANAQYENEKFLYDKENARLNKETSFYQLEDKKLELKLKRLDTERNALNTEIDAVKKVIQDATDKGFKTFSG